MIATLRDGDPVSLRPLRSDDASALQDAFRRLSDESRYRRFFVPMHDLDGSMLRYLTEIDHHDHEAIVAFDAESDAMVGVARYVRPEPGAQSAEAAVAVVDEYQGRGLGRLLLEQLVSRAREEGIDRFSAVVQADNRRAVELMSTLGPTATSLQNDLVELDIELTGPGLGAPLNAALRAAASARFGVRPLAERLTRLAKQAWEGSGGPVVPASVHGPIVVGTDGSETAAQAVAVAAELAARLKVDLHAVIACGAGQQSSCEEALSNAPPGAVTHVQEGDPAEVLIDYAQRCEAQLLVVGNKGMTGARRFLLGSVPDRVSHHARCSVLIVRTT